MEEDLAPPREEAPLHQHQPQPPQRLNAFNALRQPAKKKAKKSKRQRAPPAPEARDDGAHVEQLGAAKRGPQSDHWCFTLNNPTELLNINGWRNLQYIVYQLETGKNGTPHFQGYVQFTTRAFGERIRKLIPRAHVEAANGTHLENQAYCTKELNKDGSPARLVGHPFAGPHTWGELKPRAGKRGGRTDLLVVQQELDANKAMADIAKDHFSEFIKYERGFNKYRDLRIQHRTRETHDGMVVVWIWGPSGTGKTSSALVHAGDQPTYWAPQAKANGIRFDSYNYESCVIFDDYHAGGMTWTMLMRLLQPYPLEVPTDGGSKKFVAHTIIFTSVDHPALLYKKHLDKLGRDWTELERRITTLEHLTVVHPEAFRGGRHPGPPEAQPMPAIGNPPPALVFNNQIYLPHP